MYSFIKLLYFTQRCSAQQLAAINFQLTEKFLLIILLMFKGIVETYINKLGKKSEFVYVCYNCSFKHNQSTYSNHCGSIVTITNYKATITTTPDSTQSVLK